MGVRWGGVSEVGRGVGVNGGREGGEPDTRQWRHYGWLMKYDAVPMSASCLVTLPL